MNKIMITLMLLFVIGFNQGCMMLMSSTINKDNMLRIRVEKAYEYWKERNGRKFMELYHDQVHKTMSTQEKVNEFEKRFGILLEYNIKEIEIIDERAKVKVECKIKLEDKDKDKEHKEALILYDKHVDYWIFKDNDWYLYEFSKAW